MSKTKVHVLIPFTVKSACGSRSLYKLASYREDVTCKICLKSDYYRDLPRRKKS